MTAETLTALFRRTGIRHIHARLDHDGWHVVVMGMRSPHEASAADLEEAIAAAVAAHVEAKATR